MKPTEIRVGNLIYNDRCVNSILFIGYDAVELLTKQGGYISAKLALIQPIPLTEKWLTDFGFTEGKNSWWDIKYDCPNDDLCIMSVNHNSKNVSFGNDDEDATVPAYGGCVVRYVHQLQNLYFALTGTELILKP